MYSMIYFPDEQTNPQTVLMDTTRLLQTQYGFSNITIQTEMHTDVVACCLQCQDPMDWRGILASHYINIKRLNACMNINFRTYSFSTHFVQDTMTWLWSVRKAMVYLKEQKLFLDKLWRVRILFIKHSGQNLQEHWRK